MKNSTKVLGKRLKKPPRKQECEAEEVEIRREKMKSLDHSRRSNMSVIGDPEKENGKKKCRGGSYQRMNSRKFLELRGMSLPIKRTYCVT